MSAKSDSTSAEKGQGQAPREPLGPARERPYDADGLVRLVLASPVSLPAVSGPVPCVAGSALYLLTDVARESARTEGGAVSLGSCVCALGAFDGVHLGHRELVGEAVRDARGRGVASVAVTFDPDPALVLTGTVENAELLSVADRLRALAALGVDALLVIPFTPQLAATTHESFLTDILFPAVRPICIHVGSNFRMGAGGLGTVDALSVVAGGLGSSLRAHELACVDGGPVSATRVRTLLREKGDVAEAARLLGRHHLVRGTVVRGRGQGTAFGFPTANLDLSPASCRPAEGVYAALAVTDGHAWPAAVNVGAPRSFGGEEGKPFLEATLLGFSGDLYGSELAILFVEWLREPRKFPSFEVLEQTVLGNVEWVRRYVGPADLLADPRAANGSAPDASSSFSADGPFAAGERP